EHPCQNDGRFHHENPPCTSSRFILEAWHIIVFHRKAAVYTRLMIYLAVLILSLASIAARAENWPQWRGPDGIGVARDAAYPVEWSATQNVLWKAPLKGLGVSTPIVFGDRVYVTYQVGENALKPGVHPTLVQGGAAAASGEHALGGARPHERAE